MRSIVRQLHSLHLHRLLQDFCDHLFRLFDSDGRGLLVQESWIAMLKENTRWEKNIHIYIVCCFHILHYSCQTFVHKERYWNWKCHMNGFSPQVQYFEALLIDFWFGLKMDFLFSSYIISETKSFLSWERKCNVFENAAKEFYFPSFHFISIVWLENYPVLQSITAKLFLYHQVTSTKMIISFSDDDPQKLWSFLAL